MDKKPTRHNLIEYVLASTDPTNKKHSLPKDISLDVLALDAEIHDFLDQIPGGFFIYEATGEEKIIFVNKATLRIFGCKTEEEFRKLTNNSFRGMVHPDDLDAVESSITTQIAESQFDLDYVKYRIRRKDGAVRWIEDYGHFIHNDVLGDLFYVFIDDSTEKIERQKAENAKLLSQNYEREKKIESLIEEYDNERKLINQAYLRRLEVIEGLGTDYESVLHVNLDTDIVVPYRVSKRTKMHFGKALNQKNFTKYAQDYVNTWVCDEFKDAVAQCLNPDYIRERLSQRSSFYINYRCNYYGEIQEIQMRIVNVGEGLSQIVIGYRDITEELRVSSQQRQLLEDALENAQHAAKVKDIFLANMSHDMRTPLNAIFGYTKIAKNNLDNPEAVKEYLEKIEIAGGTILELIQDVLEASNAESQTNNLVEAECNVVDVVAEACKSLQSKASRKDIKLIQNCAGIKNGDVIADADKIKQILWQLVDNAIKFSRTGETVVVTATQEGTALGGFAKYRFTVADNGVGIGEEALPRIFDPFEREFNSTASGQFGGGLGLTIVKKFIDMMEGKIDVASTVGKGSTFTVTLNLHVRESGRSVDVESLQKEVSGKKFLIVDDNEINLEIEAELLEEVGFSTDCAQNGKVALDKLEENPEDYYAVVLMDIQMPVMDGWEATQAIRGLKNPKLANIPIIAVSANSFESDIRTSIKSGMDAHLAKPMDVNELLATVAQIITSRKQ